ncbi:MAG: SRPBCC family protein [Rhizobiaceae bacterium]|nr:SRPBCC family protein [Rhizobiaceae bacterium]MCV0405090.1 SRPBCC family protein [Rhizobiaceae bacterium]
MNAFDNVVDRAVKRVAPDTARVERHFDATAERLWDYLVEADKRRLWFSGGDTISGAGDRTKLVFDHSVFADEPTPERFSQMDEGGISFEVEVTTFEPPHRLAFTWPEGEHISEVTIDLVPQDRGVRLVLTHSRLRDAAQMANVASGWHAHLDVLDDLLAGRSSRGFWTNALRLEQDYSRAFGA